MLRASAPGNLLLLGEYAVLEEGGLGLAAAIGPRVAVESSPSDELRVEGLMGPSRLSWKEGGPVSAPLVEACIRACRAAVEAALGDIAAHSLRALITIDSSVFFGTDGSKLGFGSSAAVALSLCAVLLKSAGFTKAAFDRAIFPTALEAHRAAQSGRGSGYDVAASLFGGLGLFTGGALPSWQRLDPAILPRSFLFRGPGPVASPAAVAAWSRWKLSDPSGAEGFLARSREGLQRFLKANDDSGRVEALARSGEAGIELGERLRYPAALNCPLPKGLPAGTAIKALGAGNEVGILMARDDIAAGQARRAGLMALDIDRAGLVLEEL